MIFTDLKFAFFFVVVFSVHWLLRRDQWRKLWLLCASYVFYAAWDARFLSLIVMSTAVDFVAADQMSATSNQRVRRRWLVLSLVVNLGMLAVFKYCNFFIDTAIDLAAALGSDGFERTFELILPVGISFFTFQTLSYTIDVYRKELEPISNPFDFALYVAFFPQLVAGPIVRAREFLPQLGSRRVWSDVNLRIALTLFLTGYIKKACISDNLSSLIDPVFANPSNFDWVALFGATLGYSVQIYCDFSGYSDMAIATAALLGYSLCENFRFPYFAIGLRDFWRRWHISLSTWLRDYLYIPLGGNRHQRSVSNRGARDGNTTQSVSNQGARDGNTTQSADEGSHNSWFSRLAGRNSLLITMLLGGLWHGAAWHFLVWGALHGAALVVAHRWPKSLTPTKLLGRTFAVVATFVFVSLLWIVFRVPQIDDAAQMIWCLITGSSPGRLGMGSYLWPFLIVFATSHCVAARWSPTALAQKLPDAVFWLAMGGGTALALSFANRKVVPFIYFQF
jgi:alginate O-acetyltransferase complex protein AlgI